MHGRSSVTHGHACGRLHSNPTCLTCAARSALAFQSAVAIASLPSAAAHMSGVLPNLSRASTSAPAWRSNLADSILLPATASARAEKPLEGSFASSATIECAVVGAPPAPWLSAPPPNKSRFNSARSSCQTTTTTTRRLSYAKVLLRQTHVTPRTARRANCLARPTPHPDASNHLEPPPTRSHHAVGQAPP